MFDKAADPAGAVPDPGSGSRRPPSEQQREVANDNLSGFVQALRQRRLILIATVLLVPLCGWLTLR